MNSQSFDVSTQCIAATTDRRSFAKGAAALALGGGAILGPARASTAAEVSPADDRRRCIERCVDHAPDKGQARDRCRRRCENR